MHKIKTKIKSNFRLQSSLPFSTLYFYFIFLCIHSLHSPVMVRRDGTVYSVCLKAMRSQNPWSSTNSEAASLSSPFYTAKPVRSWLGTPGNLTVLSQVVCKTECGSRRGLSWLTGDGRDVFRIICIRMSRMFFMNEDTRMQE